MSPEQKNALICRVQAHADEIIPTGYAIDASWKFAQDRAIRIVRQFTSDLEVYSARYAYNVALIDLSRLADVCAHQTHDLAHVRAHCDCDHCREFLTRNTF